jgi:hypothetical protein
LRELLATTFFAVVAFLGAAFFEAAAALFAAAAFFTTTFVLASMSDIRRSPWRAIKLVKIENCEAGNKP